MTSWPAGRPPTPWFPHRNPLSNDRSLPRSTTAVKQRGSNDPTVIWWALAFWREVAVRTVRGVAVTWSHCRRVGLSASWAFSGPRSRRSLPPRPRSLRRGRRPPAYTPLANVNAVSCAPSASRELRDLRGRGRRRWQRGLHHRHPERRHDVVGLDSPSRRDHAVHRLVPVVSRLLRRRGCGNHEVERRRRELDDSGLVLPASVDFLLHDRRMHGGRGDRDRRDN